MPEEKSDTIRVYWTKRCAWIVPGFRYIIDDWEEDIDIWVALLFSKHPEREFLGVCLRDRQGSEFIPADLLDEDHFHPGRSIQEHAIMNEECHASIEVSDKLTDVGPVRKWIRGFIVGNPRCAQKS